MATGLRLRSGFGPKEFSVIFNWTLTSENHTADLSHFFFDDLHESPVTPLGVISATLLGLLLTSSHSISKFISIKRKPQLPQWILLFIIMIVITPIIAALAFYRLVVSCLLKHILAPDFVELMKGPDAVWNLRDVSRPIISILAEVESPRGANYLLEDLLGALQSILKMYPKLAWKRRTSVFGYSYWERRQGPFPLEQHVRWLPEDTLGAGKTISMSTLQRLLSDMSNAPLPENDSSCWEILVGSSKIDNQEYCGREVFPVFIRVHHSIGDGISLMELLVKGLSSNHSLKQEWKGSYLWNKGMSADNMKNIDVGYVKLEIENEEYSTDSHEQRQTNIMILPLDYKKILQVLKKCCYAPTFIVNTLHTFYALLTTAMSLSADNRDLSILDGHQLSGEKLLAFYRDNEDNSLLSLIKKIKSQKKGIRFTDVFLSALSAALYKYFKNKSGTVSDNVSVVIPVYVKHLFGKNDNICIVEDYNKRHPVEEKSIDLDNCFSLGILKLPLEIGDKVSAQARLQRVSESMSSLHNSGQFLLNVVFLRWMAALLPGNLLNIFLKSAGHTTMVVSNLIGPGNSHSIAGHPLKNLFFWVPNRGNTGVGISILSYNNHLQLGLIMDRALATTNEEAQQLLNKIVSELQNMNEEITKNTCLLL